MELRHLRYFVALAQELHFGRAADRLHIVQPALSKQIAALEAELGVQLFERTKRSVTITEAGRVLHDEARSILQRVDNAVERTQQTARGEVGGLDIGFIEPAMWAVVPPALTEHRRRAPGVRFRLWQGSSAELVHQLLDGAIDLAFVRMPLHESELTFHLVASEPFVVALPEDHRLAADPEIDLVDLADAPFVLTPRASEPGYFDRCLALCRENGFSPRIVEEGNGPSAICGMVATGLGVSLSPASIRNVPWRGVVFRPIARPAAQTQLDLACAHRREDERPVLTAFLATVDDLAAGG